MTQSLSSRRPGILPICLTALTLLAVLSTPLLAQSSASLEGTGTLIGTVTDTNDDVLEGASVTIQGADSRDLQTERTGDNGFFQFGNLKPGAQYQVTVRAQGFTDWTSQAIILEPGQHVILSGCKLRINEAHTSVDVTYSPVEVATEQVATEEKQRVLGFIPNFYVVYDANPEPLTTKLKFKLAWKVVQDPVTVVGIAFLAGVDQAGNTPDYEQGASGYGKRFGANAADGFTDIMLGGAIFPSLLHQDPRYFYQGTGTVKSRILHAVSAPFVCRGDNGRRQLNYSSLGGDLASSAISNLYYPSSNRGASLVFGNFALGTAERVFAAISQEFLLRKLTLRGKEPN